MGWVLVELDSGLVVPGLIQFAGRTFKSTAFTTVKHNYYTQVRFGKRISVDKTIFYEVK